MAFLGYLFAVVLLGIITSGSAAIYNFANMHGDYALACIFCMIIFIVVALGMVGWIASLGLIV